MPRETFVEARMKDPFEILFRSGSIECLSNRLKICSNVLS